MPHCFTRENEHITAQDVVNVRTLMRKYIDMRQVARRPREVSLDN